MSEHVSLEIADLLAGRLAPERERELMRHIESCPECAAEVAFARQFVESALAQGLAHVLPERVTMLADEPGKAMPAERRHLESCEACRAEIEWARGTKESPAIGAGAETAERPAEGEPKATSERPAPRVFRLRPRVWVSAAAGVAAVLAVVFLVRTPPEREPTSYADLIVASPLRVRIPRSEAPEDSFAVARLQGLEAYAEGNYAAARERFDEALASRGEDAEVLLYAGSSRLLAGDAAGAAPLLGTGLRHAGTEELRAELSWQLADALFETGDIKGARRLLESLASQGGGYSAAARGILERIR